MNKKSSLKNLIKAEYKKIVFLKFSKIFLISLVIASLVLGLVFSLTTNATQGKDISEMNTIDVISACMLGVDVTAIMLIIFAAISNAREFSTKLIHVTLSVTPNRKRFFISKLITYFLVATVISLVVTIITFFAGQLILIFNGRPLASIADPSLRQFIFGTFVMPVFYCVLTVAALFIFRNSGGAITFSLGIMFVPALVKMFSQSIQKIVLPLLPQASLHSLSGTALKGSYEILGNGASIILLLVWIGITSLIGVFQFVRKDV
jgi:ABC-type transport system involved in multi-copper enzyme maturation permease subunit